MRIFTVLALAVLAGCSDRSGQSVDPRISDASRADEEGYALGYRTFVLQGGEDPSTITITEARSRDVDFSAPYAFGGACFLYRTGDPKPRMSQIAKLLIGVEADTIEDVYLCFHGGDPKRFSQLEEAVTALENKEIDVVLFDDLPLKKVVEDSQGRFSVTPLVTRDGYGVAVDKRRPDVLEAANAVIAEGGAK